MIRDLNFLQSELSKLNDVAGRGLYNYGNATDIQISTAIADALALKIDNKGIRLGVGLGVAVGVSLNGKTLAEAVVKAIAI
jgi:hypothetical protein